MVRRKCEQCQKDIEVRQADIDRGWGKFCSKSCKARKQAKLFNIKRVNKPVDEYLEYSNSQHPFDIDQ